MPDLEGPTAKTHRRVPAMPAEAQMHGLPKLSPAMPTFPIPKGRQSSNGLGKSLSLNEIIFGRKAVPILLRI